jgi:uncharacterized protein YndB with AHSA1/START domain
MEKITVTAGVHAPLEKVWAYYTEHAHITQWNFADPSWHCPCAENDMRIGGTYKARMEARDGSSGFDFEAVYTEINPPFSFIYGFGERTAKVEFHAKEDGTNVIITFDPETIHSVDLQRNGWQAILNNFKSYTEHEA